MLTAILVVFLFALMIFPHELGHFLAAKFLGVQVNEFAFGMGPALWKHQGKFTLYSIRLFPVGGFCQMEGEDEDTGNAGSFSSKPGWAKILILAAGSFMNVLIALLVMCIMMGVIGSPVTTVKSVQKGSPAMAAGLQAKDEIVSVGGKRISNWQDIENAISTQPGKISVTVKRDGQKKSFSMVPKKYQGRYIIGITPEANHGPILALCRGTSATWKMTGTMFTSLRMLFTGKVSADEVSGPVGIVSLVHQSVHYGLYAFFYLLSLISINLAFINMLPLPALDGGRIIFVLLRGVTGKRITDNMEAAVHAAGFLLLIGLMVLVTYNDILKLFR